MSSFQIQTALSTLWMRSLFILYLRNFQTPLLYLLLTKTHQMAQWPRLQTVPYFFSVFLFYKIVVLFHSSLSLSTIKYQLFSGVKFGFLYLYKTKLCHSLLWVVRWQSCRLSWEVGWLPCWWPRHRSPCSELMYCFLRPAFVAEKSPGNPRGDLTVGKWFYFDASMSWVQQQIYAVGLFSHRKH